MEPCKTQESPLVCRIVWEYNLKRFSNFSRHLGHEAYGGFGRAGGRRLYCVCPFSQRMYFRRRLQRGAIKNIKEAIELYLEVDTNELIEFTGEKIIVTL